MTIPWKAWRKYIDDLRLVNEQASKRVLAYLSAHEIVTPEQVDDLIRYCYGLATKYGEAAAELAAQMYDSLAAATGATVEAAVPAATATYGEVANAVLGVRKQSQNDEMVSAAIGRLVKMAGVDTTMQNALRDGAEWAWIPVGDTCAFCIALASRGWQRASKKAIKGGHAEHIHSNCDCTYAIRFDDSEVAGYDGGTKYAELYYGADGNTPEQRINAMRREFYAENRDRINEQKRDAYQKSKELNSSAAEELDV